jgi:hypothetical protein
VHFRLLFAAFFDSPVFDSPDFIILSEVLMQDYEIRILGDRHHHTIIEVMHLNDSSAIRAARSLAAGQDALLIPADRSNADRIARIADAGC